MCAAPKGNQYAIGNNGGRPLSFNTVEELDTKIEAYFKSCYKVVKDEDGNKVTVNYIPLTISGLALALDCDRKTLLNYSNKEEYFSTIHKAKLKIENFAECSLWQPKIATGIMFNLKNNYGWVDKQEITTTNIDKTVKEKTTEELLQELKELEDKPIK